MRPVSAIVGSRICDLLDVTEDLVAAAARGVLPHSIGIETRGGVFTKLLERNAPLPAQCSEIFTTTDFGQAAIKIKVFRGENSVAARNKKLGVYEVSGLPPAPPLAAQIQITFLVDTNGRLWVTAKDLASGIELPVGGRRGAR
jgi:molecular chaperone DnaK